MASTLRNDAEKIIGLTTKALEQYLNLAERKVAVFESTTQILKVLLWS